MHLTMRDPGPKRPLRPSPIHALALALGCSSSGGGTPTDAAVAVADTSADVAGAGPGAPCTSRSDCATGWCGGLGGCDSVGTCTDEVPCSAAPPFVACTCAGRYDSLAAGCPDTRWGHQDNALPEYLMGTACDPATPADRRDLTLTLSGLDAVPEGSLVYGAVTHAGAGVTSRPTSAVVQGAAAQLSFYSGYDMALPTMTVTWWVGAAECAEATTRYATVVTAPVADATPATATGTPADLTDAPCP